MIHVLLKPGLKNFEHYFTSMWDEYQLRLSAKCHFQGLKTGLCLVPTGLRASPGGNQHWWRDLGCVCVCVCVCSLSYLFPTGVFPLLPFTVGWWREKALQLGLKLCLKYTVMMNINVGEEADRQTVGSLSTPQEFGTVQWLNWRWFWPQETFDNVRRYSGVVRRIEERSELLVAHRMEARDAIKQPMIETTGHPVIQSQGSVVSGLRPPGDVRSWPPGHWGPTWWGGSNEGPSRPVFVWGTSYFRNIS